MTFLDSPSRRRNAGMTTSALAILALLAAAPAFAEDCDYPGFDQHPHAPGTCHPYPQPLPRGQKQTTTGCPDACLTEVQSAAGIFAPSNPFRSAQFLSIDPERYAGKVFPGTNFLPTIYTNLYDSQGNEMANTLPSTPHNPYNLHDGEPEVRQINPTSPTDDLFAIFDLIEAKSAEWMALKRRSGVATAYQEGELGVLASSIRGALQLAVDILEGSPVENRAYSGLPLLHFHGPNKVKAVEPIYEVAVDAATQNETKKLVGGNVEVHQIWFDQHIESDVAFLDPSAVEDVPWTVTYHVDVLSKGHDDFSPFAIFFVVDGNGKKTPHVGMDQTFFDMQEGTRTTFKIKMPPGKYLNLVYTWGWRMHPPRIQVMENATKKIDYGSSASPACPREYQGKTLPELEAAVFGADPTKDQAARERAIAKIGALSPAKRMWEAFRDASTAADAGLFDQVRDLIRDEAKPAFDDWRDRTRLPDGVELDPESDITILYVNNTIYGELTAGGWVRWDDWESRYSEWEREHAEWQAQMAAWPQRHAEWAALSEAERQEVWAEYEQAALAAELEGEPPPRPPIPPEEPQRPAGPPVLDVTILNGDYFVHGYVNVDFGGNRGWENQFKSSVRVAGSGCWFTFGRAHWWMNAGGTAANGWICVPEAKADGTPGRHRVSIEYNYEPSRRLRFYQFDPFHHDVAIYSIH